MARARVGGKEKVPPPPPPKVNSLLAPFTSQPTRTMLNLILMYHWFNLPLSFIFYLVVSCSTHLLIQISGCSTGFWKLGVRLFFLWCRFLLKPPIFEKTFEFYEIEKGLHEKDSYKGVCSGIMSFKNSSSSTSRTTLAADVREGNIRYFWVRVFFNRWKWGEEVRTHVRVCDGLFLVFHSFLVD